MAVVAGKIAGYVVVETTAAGVRLVKGGVQSDRAIAMQEAYRRDIDARTVVVESEVYEPPAPTFAVHALIEVDEP